jgi:hypothetical protein
VGGVIKINPAFRRQNKDFLLVGWRKGTKGLPKALFCVQKVWVWINNPRRQKSEHY